MFMETSAKAGHNVKSLFKKIAMSLVGMEKEGEQQEAQNASMCLRSPPYTSASDSCAQKSTSRQHQRAKSPTLRNASAKSALYPATLAGRINQEGGVYYVLGVEYAQQCTPV